MTRDDALKRYTFHNKLALVTGYSRQHHDQSNHLRPIAQLKIFVDCDGELPLDKELDELINKVCAIKIRKEFNAIHSIIEEQSGELWPSY
jgi:CelD/BcsL family acetyltransferase involved in cellulose biosynthesis